MKHNYSFVETLNYMKSIAPKYEFRKPVRLDTHLSDIMPVQSGHFKFGIMTEFFDDLRNHFGIKLGHRKGMQVTTVRDLVILVYKISHDKIK